MTPRFLSLNFRSLLLPASLSILTGLPGGRQSQLSFLDYTSFFGCVKLPAAAEAQRCRLGRDGVTVLTFVGVT